MKNGIIGGYIAFFLLFSTPTMALVVDELVVIKEVGSLTGKIEVKDLANIDQQRLSIKIADPSLYRQMGLFYNSFLADLQPSFVTINKDEGLVSIAFPYGATEVFDLLIQFEWPQGRLVHRYIVRLQSSLFATAERVVVRISPTDILVRAAETRERDISAINERMHSVQVETIDGDNWRNVAQAIHQAYLRDSTINIEQVMLALRDANPDDFIGRQSSILRVGASLRLPDYYDITTRNPAAARRALVTILRRPTTKPRLELTVTRTEENAAASGAAAAVTLEELDKTISEEAELGSELALVDAQLERIERLIDLKQEEIAIIQAVAAEQEQQVSGGIRLLNASGNPQPRYDLRSALQQRWEGLVREIQTRPWVWSAAVALILFLLSFCAYLFMLLNRRQRGSGQDKAAMMRELRRTAMHDSEQQTQLFTTDASRKDAVETKDPPDVKSPPSIKSSEQPKKESVLTTPDKQEEPVIKDKKLVQDNPRTADLDLALAYINMSEPGRARPLLEGVLENGSPVERKKAQELLNRISP